MNKLAEVLKIADIHVNRIQVALEHIHHFLPFDEKNVSQMTIEDLVWVELLVSRFGKLQDLIGSAVIDMFLESVEELSSCASMLDKINQLERMAIIDNAQTWKDMRKSRNRIAHEYPDAPELSAKYLNEIVYFCPKLIEILNNIKSKIK